MLFHVILMFSASSSLQLLQTWLLVLVDVLLLSH